MASTRSSGLLPLLFGLEVPVGRVAYATAGFSLMAIKYGVDALLARQVLGKAWTPLEYLSPLKRDRVRVKMQKRAREEQQERQRA